MSTNNVYYVDMKQRFNDYRDGKIDMRQLHPMVYDMNNVAFAVRQLSKTKGRMAKGQNGTNYQTLENYSIAELSAIVKDRLLNKKMDYVRRTYIPKGKSGKMRPLGICSVWDKLVEKCIQLVIEPYCETRFVVSSFGFREQVSQHNALAKVKNQCQTMPFVLSIDLQNYFGTIDPQITYRELWHIGIKDQVILNYIYRFIKKGYFEASCKHEDPIGAPQGSSLGPLISNLYLHRFDVWLRDQGDQWHDKTVGKFHDPGNKRRNLGRTNLKIGIHVRFADDILVLCKDKTDAKRFKFSITKYLTTNMKLIINEEKTKIYDLTKERMKYLGYEFYVRKFICKTKKGVLKVNNLLPKAKEDEIVERCGELLKAIQKKTNFETIHAWNTYVVGLHNYYCGMTNFYQSFSRIGWRIFKLFYHTMNTRVTFTNEHGHKNGFMGGKYKTWGIKGYYCFETYPVIEIRWANWDSTLIDHTKVIIRKNPYEYGRRKHSPGVSLEDIDYLVNSSRYIKNSRLAMFRISKYSSVKGKSYLSGVYVPVDDYHCHHILPREKGGVHDFDNLCVLSKTEHFILHGANPEILYDLYPKKRKRIDKDTSRKIKSAYKAKSASGKPVSSYPPYGFLKSPEDKCKWVVDPEAAAVVRRIFQLTMEAKGPYQICCILKDEKVPIPAYYLAQKGAGLHQRYSFPDPYNWHSTTVCGILKKKEYLGHTVNFKTRKHASRLSGGRAASIDAFVYPKSESACGLLAKAL